MTYNRTNAGHLSISNRGGVTLGTPALRFGDVDIGGGGITNGEITIDIIKMNKGQKVTLSYRNMWAVTESDGIVHRTSDE